MRKAIPNVSPNLTWRWRLRNKKLAGNRMVVLNADISLAPWTGSELEVVGDGCLVVDNLFDSPDDRVYLLQQYKKRTPELLQLLEKMDQE